MTHAASSRTLADRDGTAAHPVRGTTPLAVYLNDHLLGATSGGELARRVAKRHAMSPAGAVLVRLADDIAQDRAALLHIMNGLGVPVRRYKMLAGWALEKAGRAKSNGFVLRRAPLSSVLELEALRLGVEGKRLMWQALRSASRTAEPGGPEADGLDEEQLTGLIRRARDQAETLEELRLQAATRVLQQAPTPV